MSNRRLSCVSIAGALTFSLLLESGSRPGREDEKPVPPPDRPAFFTHLQSGGKTKRKTATTARSLRHSKNPAQEEAAAYFQIFFH